MPRKKAFRLLQMFRVEELRAGAVVELAPGALADRVAEGVAGDGGDEATDRERPDVQVALGGEKPGGEEQTVARQEEADQQPGLGKDDEHHAEHAGGADEIVEVEM